MAPPNLSVAALDQAVDTILQNNFDADTKECLITLMKVLDNVIQKPFDNKVRSIRLANPAFNKKVASRKGGVEFLLACGFVQETPPPPLLSKGNEPQEVFLVLKDDDDSLMDETERQIKKEAYTKHIVTARRLLLTRAVKDLNLKAEELPAYKPPPPPVATDSNFTSKRDSSSAFNPFQHQRYDGMSAAVGTQLTPDGTYVSKTEEQLKTLQEKQKKLEQKLQRDLQDREWVASHPNASGKPTAIIQASEEGPVKGDAGLIGAQFAKQQAAKKQREEGGFTTKSMRELEKLKKQKVYSHSRLALQFADGTTLQGKFLPKETIGQVLEAMKDCFLVTPTGPMELYITPPRKTLAPNSSLQDQGLVPAAKVFVKIQLPDHRPYLKPELFQLSTPAFPDSQAVVAEKEDSTSKPAAAGAAAPKPPLTAEEKEEEMMRRMMGGGRKLGSGGAKSDGGSAAKKPATGKPKWFKN